MIWVLPGATAEPADLYEYRRSHRTHWIRVRDGSFEDLQLTPGPAVIVVDLRDRPRSASNGVVASRWHADAGPAGRGARAR